MQTSTAACPHRSSYPDGTAHVAPQRLKQLTGMAAPTICRLHLIAKRMGLRRQCWSTRDGKECWISSSPLHEDKRAINRLLNLGPSHSSLMAIKKYFADDLEECAEQCRQSCVRWQCCWHRRLTFQSPGRKSLRAFPHAPNGTSHHARPGNEMLTQM